MTLAAQVMMNSMKMLGLILCCTAGAIASYAGGWLAVAAVVIGEIGIVILSANK